MPKKSEDSKLENLKKEYSKLQKKYSLPSFEKLNEDFGVEKAAESETDFPIREIRKIISEKAYSYLRLVETFMNPANAPMSIMSVAKSFGAGERGKLGEIYKKLVKSEFHLIAVDIEFSEKKEAEFVKSIFRTWQEIKKEFLEIVDSAEKNDGNRAEASNRRYFG